MPYLVYLDLLLQTALLTVLTSSVMIWMLLLAELIMGPLMQ